MSFISLHNQSEYSLLDSLASLDKLFKKAKELNQTAIAITDHGTLAGIWEAYNESKKTGVKLIVGIESYFQNDNSKPEDKLKHIILLAKNHEGYQNLLRLNRAGFESNVSYGKKRYSVIDWNLLEKYSNGLICLTACGNGIISSNLMKKNFEQAEQDLLRLKDIFGENLAVEVQPNNMKRFANYKSSEIDQNFLNNQLIKLAIKTGIKIVPACNTHYVDKEQSKIHDALLAIGSQDTVNSNFRIKYPVPEFYLKSEEEVLKFFSRNFNVLYGENFSREIIDNTQYFSDLCEEPKWVDPKYTNPSGKELPTFPIKDESDYQEFLSWKSKLSDNLINKSEDVLFLRYRVEKLKHVKIDFSKVDAEVYNKRIEEELEVFEYCGISSYMLIVADYLNAGRKMGVPIGPGRGSAGGSLITYILDIHQADPIKYNLILARFHNKLKKAMSDIDVDVSQSGREKVINYIINKYGQEHVASISNIIRITPKVYARDICRAFEIGGDKESAVKIGTDIADSIPKKDEDSEIQTMDEAFEASPLFEAFCQRYSELLEYKEICEKPRSFGTHAAGIVIGTRKLSEIVPLRVDADNNQVLELDKDTAEEASLVKMDVLGLSTLDIIYDTFTLIQKAGKPLPDLSIKTIESYDKETYDLISRGDTFKVFQFGTSGGTIALCKKMFPKSIEDLALITTLARPASKAIRGEFIETKDGKKEPKYLHPSLKNALKDTFAYPLYDESLLVLAKDVAGWDLNEADKLRKLTKEKGKNPEKVKKWKEEFIGGAVKNNVSEKDSNLIWEKVIEPYGRYSFNKSLSVFEKIDIYTPEGNFIESKKIEDVVPGDYVRSRNEKTKKDIFVEVKAKHDHGILPLVEVELTTGEKVKCTMNHKFRVKENGEMLPLWKIIKEKLSIIVNTA